ncbi:MAG: hypothetical protein IJC71_08385 [Clostridia bacterium]|nr:hypothetical protein [Clostridia bacterium]
MSGMERIKILVAITERGNGRELVEWMAKRGIGYQFRLSGQGTASSEMMDILGLGSSDKDIVISLGKQSAIEAVAHEFTDSMASMRRGRGIMMLLSPNAVGNLMASILSMQEGIGIKEGEEPMKNEHKHSLILISVNQGYTDQVMQTARLAGAMGGTIVKARLAEEAAAEQFQGLALQPEKEIVAILAADTIKAKIMNDVNAVFGLTSEAQGVVLSLPVDKAFKI